MYLRSVGCTVLQCMRQTDRDRRTSGTCRSLCHLHCSTLQQTDLRYIYVSLQYTLQFTTTYDLQVRVDVFVTYTATHCNTLQYTAIHCNMLQHTASHCITLRHTASHHITLQHDVTHCNALQRTATHCNTLQRTTTHCNTLQPAATHCSTL